MKVFIVAGLLAGFCLGLGFMLAQDLWWGLTGIVGLCRG